jgi:glucose-1-phosphate thymidylyltransferase
LLEVCGKTLIDHTLDKFKTVDGIEEIVVVTNAKFYEVMCRWAKARGPEVRVVNDGTHTPEERLGAIGDILYILKQEKTLTDWAVVGSDNIFDQGVEEFFSFARAKSPAVTVGAYDLGDVAGADKYGVFDLGPDARVLSLEEKPKVPRSSLISMCLYFFPRASLRFLEQFVDETHKMDTTGGYVQWLYQKTEVYGFKFSGKWYDIGSLESYNEAQNHFLD